MEDNRKTPRGSIRWRCVLVTEEKGRRVSAQGKTHDINITGVAIISERNIPLQAIVTVHLLVHPGDRNTPQLIVEAQGKIMNSVLSSQQGGFRLGIQFLKFADDSKQLLQKHLPKGLPQSAGVPSAAVTTPNSEMLPTSDQAPADDPAPAATPAASPAATPAVDPAPAVDPTPADDPPPTADPAPADDAPPDADSAPAVDPAPAGDPAAAGQPPQ
ncbi:MAG: PilZ domain-containing protein [Betaproteobacteria bacterium]|nr:PilZ domain-containing protein [Betaproteobacteria bacterium]